ncbi:hypothetical protein [Amycolatopsis solani]|uniref:hypothetical protein n=1 Tax=Amycolatopsis solani TaxID=3028615 RepID=UPI0025AF9D51|nr:hypothetical protein [Amycolatopsis sp. MEP2-6]
MTEPEFPENPVGDLTLPVSARTGARNRALSGQAPRLSQNSLSTLDITPVFTVAFAE